jgi:hypothetical protein
MVHVTSEAKARPIMTALTMTSADRNIDQGDNSRGTTMVDFSGLLSPSAGAAVDVEAAGAAVCVGGAGTADGCDGDGVAACCGAGGVCCCAKDDDDIASARITANVARNGDMFIL